MALRQEWYTLNDDEGQIVDDASAGSDEKIAQSFTLGTTGDNFGFDVSRVFIKGKKVTGVVGIAGNVTVRIQGISPAGEPDGTDLATGTIAASVFTTSDAWMVSEMTSITSLQKGQQYSLVIDGSTLTTINADDYFVLRADGSAPAYTGGGMFTFGSGIWTSDATTDLMFQIEGGAFTGTLCELNEAINRAGVNVNSVAINEIIVNEFVLQAEAEINLDSRIDWVTAYSGLDTKMKRALNKVCASLAALDIINYDASSIGSLAAQRRINNLRRIIKDGLKTLDKFDQKNFAGVESGD